MSHKVAMTEKEESRIIVLLGYVRSGEITLQDVSARTGRSTSQIDKIRKKHGVVLGDLSAARSGMSVAYYRDKRRNEEKRGKRDGT